MQRAKQQKFGLGAFHYLVCETACNRQAFNKKIRSILSFCLLRRLLQAKYANKKGSLDKVYAALPDWDIQTCARLSHLIRDNPQKHKMKTPVISLDAAPARWFFTPPPSISLDTAPNIFKKTLVERSYPWGQKKTKKGKRDVFKHPPERDSEHTTPPSLHFVWVAFLFFSMEH